ncbi:MAG: type II toxin-antitoxin system HipA family toxin [Kangiella sp.]|nr:type II toxin-antitoxin system HipA family toxin [Kangiella sp.]
MRLVVWLNGHKVGFWERRRGQEEFRYDKEWIHSEYKRPISLSMPILPGNLPHRGPVVKNYFDNLLPDSRDIRERLARKFSAKSANPFDLLTELGRDCVGAIQLLQEGEVPEDIYQVQYETLDEAGIASMIRGALTSRGFNANQEANDLRLSIAGAQEKTALLKYKGNWCRPVGSTPTTHILKLPLGEVGAFRGDMSESVENEWLCSKLASELGLDVAHCDIEVFEDQKVLSVERFDRKLITDPETNSEWFIRYPQEDMCQALGCSPLDKYQRDGGPGIAECMEVLSGSIEAEKDRKQFFKAQLIFWLLFAPDGHAKNFSIFLLAGGDYQMTPLYDILSAAHLIGNGNNQIAYQDATLALAIRGSKNYYKFKKITKDRLINQAQQVGILAEEAKQIIESTLASVDDVIETLESQLPGNFPEHLAESIFTRLRKQAGILT